MTSSTGARGGIRRAGPGASTLALLAGSAALVLAGPSPADAAGAVPSDVGAAPSAAGAAPSAVHGVVGARVAPSTSGAAVAAPQEAPDPGPGLRGFLVRVLRRSPGAEAAALRREAAGHEAAALDDPLNPALEAEGPDAEDVVQLQLRQPLRLFGQGDALRRLGRAERALAGRRLTLENASLARDAGRLWVAATARRRELSLAERSLGLRREAAGRAETALRRGWGDRATARRLRLEARAAAREVEELKGAVRRDRRELNRLLGRPAGEPLPMDGPLAGDADRRRAPPVPEELSEDAPEVAVARAGADVAEAELARARTRGRPVPAVGPMVSLGKGVDPGVSLELSLPLRNTHRRDVRAARSRLEASEAAGRATRRSARAAYDRLLGRREALKEQLQRLRSRELAPARGSVARWEASRELGLPVRERRRRARGRLLDLRREELRLQRRLTLLELDAAWRSGALLSWLREPEDGAAVNGAGARTPGAPGGEPR